MLKNTDQLLRDIAHEILPLGAQPLASIRVRFLENEVLVYETNLVTALTIIAAGVGFDGTHNWSNADTAELELVGTPVASV